MSEIPEDIREKAYKLAFTLWAMPDDDNSTRRTEVLARALLAERMAERERCAEIAEDWEIVLNLLPLADAPSNEAAAVGQDYASEEIAKDIRNQDKP